MKKMFAVITVVMVVLCFVGTHALAAGQETEKEKEKGAAIGRTPEMQGVRGQGMTQQASNIIGRDVKNDKGEDLGKVDDLIIIDGQAQYLILSHGGLLGIGEKLVPVPFQRADVTEDAVVLRDVDKQMLENAPNIGKDELRTMGEPEFERSIYGYYGEEPAHRMRGIEEDRLRQEPTDQPRQMQEQREVPKQ
jgi:sporulation protein YlmC with PRC-barrel domain